MYVGCIQRTSYWTGLTKPPAWITMGNGNNEQKIGTIQEKESVA